MKYQKEANRKKVIITLALCVVMMAFVVLIAFWIGPSMVSDTSATPTVPPKTTLEPIPGELTIKDGALENAIRHQLGIEGEVTKEHVESLEVLSYTDETITDLWGLQYAINLKEICLKVDITSIEPIKGLNIERLTFRSDLSVQPLLEAIKDMKYVTYLDLSDCGISTIGYISEMPMLETLILDNNRLAGLKYIADLKILSTLSMRNCGLNDISDLKDNRTIKYLYIEDNNITNFDVLDTMALKEVTK